MSSSHLYECQLQLFKLIQVLWMYHHVVLECICDSYRELIVSPFIGNAEERQRKTDLILSSYNLTVIQS